MGCFITYFLWRPCESLWRKYNNAGKELSHSPEVLKWLSEVSARNWKLVRVAAMYCQFKVDSVQKMFSWLRRMNKCCATPLKGFIYMKMPQDYLFNTKFESAGSTKHTNLWTQRPFYMYSKYLHSMADTSTLL